MAEITNEKYNGTLMHHDPSKYSIRSHGAHNTLVLNKGNVCGSASIVSSLSKIIKEVPRQKLTRDEKRNLKMAYHSECKE